MKEKVLGLLTSFFKKNGFKKRGNVWYSSNSSILLLCEYQGSRIMNGFYLNFGLYFPEIDDSKKIPKSYDWHFSGRYSRFLHSGEGEFNDKAFSFDSSESVFDDVLDEMFSNIEEVILPCLREMQDYRFFVDNFPEEFDFSKMWIMNITEEDFLSFVKTRLPVKS